MASFNLKSTLITNRDAVPKVLTDPLVSGGAVNAVEGYVQTQGTNDGIDSIYRLLQVPSNARVEAVTFQASGLGTGCTLDVGVYYPTFIPVGAGLSASLASTVINTTFFASAIAASAAVASTNVINQSGSNTIPKQELPLWQALGLTADPEIDLDICVHVAAAVGGVQGYVGLKSLYSYGY